MEKILVVEDEVAISKVLQAYLKKSGFEIEIAMDGVTALNKFTETKPKLVLLDVMLPGKDGWHVLKEIRSMSECPVIMLTALSDVNYRLDGLNGGADDYIAKPFSGEEVVARVHAVLRRYEKGDRPIRRYGHLQIDHEAHRVVLHQKEIELTPRDLSLLIFLSENPNKTFTREQLIEHVWGWDYDGSDRAVDLSIKRLRKALKNWPETEGEIKTLRGVGYQLSVHE
ncbi:DNA-binding response regulator, OmpR family, contains REC and winged-helix (wHTH) domain [Gracilibacillus ureilyticus]|uniref:DNA-binding response regulator, OmpR family, contains REC and winged-helix (WHTH) domain n=1 Tax=Gracilibacillus ureilyticus TaxID=531814 RepID=A0A1H9QQW5_9BACI|nr:response regulator transcription factor [Gracilibacillus ureilyticus]SER62229.1 DNA-binding response regulator, OmpR family, contains REC and winged-helix (wHTH) domain [Gracilibacillus ureilyticus]